MGGVIMNIQTSLITKIEATTKAKAKASARERAAQAARLRDEAYRRFRQAGLTHLFVNLAEGSRLRGQWPAWSAADRGVFLDFMTRHCSLVFEDRNFERADFRHTLVYRLVDAIPSEAGTEETARLLMGFFAGPTTPALPGARR